MAAGARLAACAAPALRAAQALPRGPLDGPGRGALGTAGRGVRDPGLRRRRRHRPAVRPAGPAPACTATSGPGDDFAARLSGLPRAARPARRRGPRPARSAARDRCARAGVRRVHGRVLLVGDASGYVDALTGEGIGVGLAQAEALARCLTARPSRRLRARVAPRRPARRGGSPLACSGHGTSRFLGAAHRPGRAALPLALRRPSSTTPPRPRKSSPLARTSAWLRPSRPRALRASSRRRALRASCCYHRYAGARKDSRLLIAS